MPGRRLYADSSPARGFATSSIYTGATWTPDTPPHCLVPLTDLWPPASPLHRALSPHRPSPRFGSARPRRARPGSAQGLRPGPAQHYFLLLSSMIMTDNMGTEDKGEAPQVEQTIEDTNALNEKVDQALIGYARFDILANKSKLQFGDWNTRPLVPSQVKMLLNSFLVDVVSQFNYSYGIPLVVDPSTLVEGTYSTKGDGSGSHHEAKKAELLPELKLKDGLPSDFKLAAAGGQHRLYALAEWYDIKRKQLDEWKWEEASVLSEDAGTISEDVIDDLNQED
ncbi:hypothetical protein EDC04DRAFT_2912354 [Pisolithus marmoratus]|nr:hypothetical protein EDC04DRAFT_2912354 [Pisolithus marmoratus]